MLLQVGWLLSKSSWSLDIIKVFYLVIIDDLVDFAYINKCNLCVVLLTSELLKEKLRIKSWNSLNFHVTTVYILQHLFMKLRGGRMR